MRILSQGKVVRFGGVVSWVSVRLITVRLLSSGLINGVVDFKGPEIVGMLRLKDCNRL